MHPNPAFRSEDEAANLLSARADAGSKAIATLMAAPAKP